jgi:hypothetical protein
MACFLVPATLGLITTLTRKRFPARWHINWLNIMIFGGSVALAVEHVAHGEIVPWPPFLTAMASPEDTAVMLQEMATVGVPMTLALVLAWAVMVVAYNSIVSVKKPAGASGG